MSLFRVFLDTSALFAAIWSETGGSRMILKLGEARVIQLEVNSQVLWEIEYVLNRKHPGALPDLALLLDRCLVHVLDFQTDPKLLEACMAICPNPGDARILADAWQGKVDYLVSLDQEHILNNPAVIEKMPYQIGKPGDFLAWLRNRYG